MDITRHTASGVIILQKDLIFLPSVWPLEWTRGATHGQSELLVQWEGVWCLNSPHSCTRVAQTIDLLGVSCSYHNVRAKIIEIWAQVGVPTHGLTLSLLVIYLFFFYLLQKRQLPANDTLSLPSCPLAAYLSSLIIFAVRPIFCGCWSGRNSVGESRRRRPKVNPADTNTFLFHVSIVPVAWWYFIQCVFVCV